MKTMEFTNTAQSPLREAQWLGSQGTGARRKKHATVLLPLTSLIDAFSIIVIYLLIGTQGGGLEADIPTQVQLPIAESGQIIDAEMPTVRIEKGNYYINDKRVAVETLANSLAQLKKGAAKDGVEILIQADKAMDYSDLDPLLRAGAAAGIQKLKFAVIPNK